MNEKLSRTIKLFLLWGLFYIAAQLVCFVLWRAFKNDEIMKWSLLFGLALIIFVYFKKHYVKLSFGHIDRRLVWPAVGMAVLIASAFVLAEMSAITLFDLDHLFPEKTEFQHETLEHLFVGIAGILNGCVLAPIAEEIGFRGILLEGLLKSRCRPWLAIFISALVFALAHGFVVIKFVCTLLFGMIIGWLYCRTESIIPCILMHIGNNSLSAIDISNQPRAICWVIFVGSILLLALGLWWYRKKCKFVNEFN